MLYAIISQNNDSFQCVLTSENREALIEIAELYNKEEELNTELSSDLMVNTKRTNEMELCDGGVMEMTEEKCVTYYTKDEPMATNGTQYFVIPADQLVQNIGKEFPVNLNLNPSVVQNLIEAEQLLTIN